VKRILFGISHFFDPQGNRKYASTQPNAAPRRASLTEAIRAIWQNFGAPQANLHLGSRAVFPANQSIAAEVQVAICTTGEKHLVSELDLPRQMIHHHATRAEPLYLGYEVHDLFRQCVESFDYFCFLEDDIVLRDPYIFQKVEAFTREFGADAVLQPNRYEALDHQPPNKVYIDGEMRPSLTHGFQDYYDRPRLTSRHLGTDIHFRRTTNPHAGCFFLNRDQLRMWMDRPYFLDRSAAFVSPLESAATLGIMRTFRLYKPVLENAAYLEVQHGQSRYSHMIGRAFHLTEELIRAQVAGNNKNRCLPNGDEGIVSAGDRNATAAQKLKANAT